MESWEIGLIGFIVYLALTLLKVPVGLSGMIVGFTGLAYLLGMSTAVKVMGILPFDAIGRPIFLVIALFILLGELAHSGGLGDDIVSTTQKWLGFLPGGLALSTIAACGLFATISGSSPATVGVMGRTAFPELIKHKYDPKLALGVVCCAGTFGVLIPPSSTLIFYAMFTETAVGPLFLAALIPAAITIALYAFTILLIVKLKPSWAPPADVTATLKEKVSALRVITGPVIVFSIVVGGLYTGFATPSELASFAVAVILILLVVQRRLKFVAFWESLKATVRMSTAIFIILMGIFILIPFLAHTGFTVAFISWVTSLAVNRYVIFAWLVVMYFILGMFMPNSPTMALTLPLVFPLILSLGFDAVWFGIVILKMAEIANVTPPFGLNLFVLKAVVGEDSRYNYSTLFLSIWPFVLCDLAVVGLILAFPNLCAVFK